jgi:hypothetical protein
MAGIFLRPKDVQKLEGHQTYIGAYKSYRTILDALGKQKGKKITLLEYAEYAQVRVEEVQKALQ